MGAILFLRDRDFKVSLCLEQLTMQRPEGTMQGETSWGEGNREGGEGGEAYSANDRQEFKNQTELVML